MVLHALRLDLRNPPTGGPIHTLSPAGVPPTSQNITPVLRGAGVAQVAPAIVALVEIAVVHLVNGPGARHEQEREPVLADQVPLAAVAEDNVPVAAIIGSPGALPRVPLIEDAVVRLRDDPWPPREDARLGIVSQIGLKRFAV